MKTERRDRRSWSLEGASLLLPDVRARTERAVTRIERLEAAGPERGGAVQEEILRVVSAWVREMEALGVEVEGPWFVDFESGTGAYCWRWPERELCHFHEEGQDCSDRVRIQ